MAKEKEPNWKRLGFESYAEYTAYLSKCDHGKSLNQEIQKYKEQMSKEGFKSLSEYLDHLAKQKGFKSYTQYIEQLDKKCELTKK